MCEYSYTHFLKIWLRNKRLPKMNSQGDFLVAQCLGLCALVAEGLGSISSWGTKIPKAHGVAKK